MLSYLRVENFAVVEKVELDFSKNLNILTGETGTGKSLLIDALTLFFRKKVYKNYFRDPSKKIIVEAMFFGENEEFTLRREINNAAKQKSISYLNGNMVPFVKLQEKSEELLNIYGQNEHVFLLNPSNHLLFLDNFSRNQQILKTISGIYKDLKKLKTELDDLEEKNRKAFEKLDYINFQISEIENLKMESGDDDKLEQRLKILSSSEEILSKSNMIIQDFYHKDNSVYNTMAENLKNMEYLQEIYPELSTFGDEIKKFYNLLPELSTSISMLSDKVEFSDDELNEIEEKLMKLNKLKSKYNMNLDGLLKKLENLKRESETLMNMDFSIKDKKREIEKVFATYRSVNTELRASRKKKSEELRKMVENELKRLEIKKPKFFIEFNEIEPEIDNISDSGTDFGEFYFSANPGQKPGPLKNMASGGELSRLMLVLKSITQDDVPSTYIFDEIDSGIGGKTAEFVGEKLKRIADMNQVICISHLPQIASFADKHFLIRKKFKENKTFSFADELTPKQRVCEIARLMAGSAVNDDVIKAAENLLNRHRS